MRILFCGLGSIGQRHLRNLKRLLGDTLEIHAYRVRRQNTKLGDDMRVEPGVDLEQAYGVRVHHDLAQALACRPDAAFICNPNALHVPVALECARAGVDIFMEKPLAADLSGISELERIIGRNKLLCQIGYNYRFHPGLQRLKALTDTGFFGNIVSVQAQIGEYLPNWHRYEDYRQMYAARADQGGGVILSQIHEMDIVCWFFGLPRNILCLGGKLSRLEVDVEDTATSLMQCEGIHGRFPILLHQDLLQQPPVRTFRIVGDTGIGEIDLIANRLRIYDERGAACESSDFPGFERNDMFLAQARHFLDCLEQRKPPLVDFHEGLKSLRLALAAKASLAAGGPVHLTELYPDAF